MFSTVGAFRSSARASIASSAGKLRSSIRSRPYAWRGERGVGAREGGAEDDPARRENELEAVEPESDPLEREHQRPEDEQVRAGASGEAWPARGQDEAPLEHVDDERQDDRAGHEGDRPAVHETPERQDEDEEREVATGERVGGREGHR